MHATFLERDSQVDVVLGYAAEAEAGTGRLVLVHGEAGGGKSTLLEQLEARLPDASWHWGACDGLFTPLPLAPLRDLADSIGGPLRAASQADASRETLFAALIQAVRADPGLTVLVVEDIHWADEATLDLLRFVGRRVQKERALLLVTFREEESAASSPLRQALGELARQRGTRRVALPPLSQNAIEQLVGDTGLDPAAVHHLTGGNPYFVAEVVGSAGRGLPASARDAVLARADVLDHATRGILDAAALAGARVDPALMEVVAGKLETAYDTLVRAGLLVTDGRSLRFRHEIARLSVADAVPQPRRSTVHRRILAALLERGDDDDSRLAFHAAGAGDTAAVLLHSRAAARRAAALASHSEAVEHLRSALAAGDRTGLDARSRAEVLDDLATELGLVDRWAEAEPRRAEAIELWRGLGDALHEGASLRMHARALSRLARGAEARQAIDDALVVLEPLGPTAPLARSVEYLAAVLWHEGANVDAIAASDRAAALAEALALPDVLSDVLNTRACSMMSLGQDWLPTMQRALSVALDAGCDEQAGRAYMNYYAALVDEGRVAEAEAVFASGLAFCEEREVVSAAKFLVSTRIGALEATGQWQEAVSVGSAHLEDTTVSPVRRLAALTRASPASACDAGIRMPGGSWTRASRSPRAPASRSGSCPSGSSSSNGTGRTATSTRPAATWREQAPLPPWRPWTPASRAAPRSGPDGWAFRTRSLPRCRPGGRQSCAVTSPGRSRGGMPRAPLTRLRSPSRSRRRRTTRSRHCGGWMPSAPRPSPRSCDDSCAGRAFARFRVRRDPRP